MTTFDAAFGRWRVPEPAEIAAWLRAFPARFRAYWREPLHIVSWSILALALVLRLANLDLVTFGTASALQLQASNDLLNGTLPLHGSLVNGASMPPLAVYLYALPLLFGRDPRWAAAFTALLDVAAILLTFRSLRRWVNLRAAIFTAIVWAAAPWAVLAARQISAAALAPFFCALLFTGLEPALHRGRPDGWLLAWLSGWLLVNISLYYWPALLALLLISLFYWRRVSWPAVLVATGIGLVLLVPYLYYESYVNFQDVAIVFGAGDTGTHAPVWGLNVLVAALRQTAGLGTGLVAGSAAPAFYARRLPLGFIEDLTAIVFLAGVMVGCGLLVYRVLRWRDRRFAAPYVVLSVWLVVTLSVVAVQPVREGLQDLALYTLAGYSLLGIILAALFAFVVEQVKPGNRSTFLAVRALFAVLLAAALLWPVYSTLNLHAFISRTTLLDGYGLPLRFWRQTAVSVNEALRSERANTLYVGGGMPLGADARTASLRYFLPENVEVVNLCPDDGRCLVVPLAHKQVYLALQPPDEVLAFIGQVSGREIGLTTQVDKGAAAHLYALPPVEVPAMVSLIPRRELWSIDDGPLFLGYTPLGPALPGAYLATFWSFTDLPNDTLAHGLALRVAESGRTVGEYRTTPGIDERYWRLDKVFVRWLPIPAEYTDNRIQRLEIGLYRLPDEVINRTWDEAAGEPGLAIRVDAVLVP